jgi:hypothetical protein
MALFYKISSVINRSRIVSIVCLLILLSISVVSGQNSKDDRFPFDQGNPDNTPPVKERLFYGGSLGLMFGTITDIQISPVIGFWVLPRVAFAVGPTYRYYKDRIDRTAIYGGRSYLQFVVIQDINSIIPVGVHTGLFLHAEDELLSLKTSFWKNPPPYKTGRFYVNTVMAGAGISQQIGRRSSLNLMVLWPLNDSVYELYSKPEIRISFIF